MHTPLYADCFTKGNCSIVADLNETIAELTETEENLCSEEEIQTNLIRCIKTRFPKLKQIILVDRKRTLLARWKQTKLSIWEFRTNYKGLFTPTGHRAVVGACLCIEEFIDFPESYLIKAHCAASFGGHILTNTFSANEVNEINLYDVTKAKNKPVERPLDESPGKTFLCQICNRGMILDLKDALTSLNDVYTADGTLKKNIENLVSMIKKPNPLMSSISLFNKEKKHFVQKILLHGKPGSGKTHIAKQISAYFNQTNSQLDCNEIFTEARSVDKAVTKIIQFISENKEIVILNEINNMGSRGAEVQKRLLAKFENLQANSMDFGKKTVVILTASLSESQISNITDKDNKNNRDFYSRFMQRLEIPTILERPYDQVYLLGIKLYEKNIRSISLRGLIAVIEKKFTDSRNLNKFIDVILNKIPSQVDHLSDDWFIENAAEFNIIIPKAIDAAKTVKLVK